MPINTKSSKTPHREQVAKNLCVPLVWKEKARQPEEAFSIQTSPILDPPVPPVNFQISIPFEWEEKPGKPRSFSPPRLDSVLSCSPITSIREASGERCDEDWEEEDGGERDDEDDLFELDLEAFAFDENDLPLRTFSGSTTAFLANCMSTLSGISNATPTDLLPSETDEEASSSEGDSSYIEFIFPLASPHPGFLQEAFTAENRLSDVSGHGSRRHSCCRVTCVHVNRMPPTLGHLKFTSCRRRKPKIKSTNVERRDHASALRKHKAVCCPFRTGGSGSREKKQDKTSLG
ncbi:uncharacterized protein LOC116261282 isoform X2 [Nymphaea colorata]|uniref:uncharacterized protein LOC116261282 isoform X2 n=1 Tax=Nymphaea colorata TaxID=210225 RepID=UPI00129E9E83|nr:uncharacterized protein LOC116261282 isoform X2 [Nymphaea colorata]